MDANHHRTIAQIKRKALRAAIRSPWFGILSDGIGLGKLELSFLKEPWHEGEMEGCRIIREDVRRAVCLINDVLLVDFGWDWEEYEIGIWDVACVFCFLREGPAEQRRMLFAKCKHLLVAYRILTDAKRKIVNHTQPENKWVWEEGLCLRTHWYVAYQPVNLCCT